MKYKNKNQPNLLPTPINRPPKNNGVMLGVERCSARSEWAKNKIKWTKVIKINHLKSQLDINTKHTLARGQAVANTAIPWGEICAPWLLLSLLCTIGLLSCVTHPPRPSNRRVARARRRIVRVASLPCFARWVVRSLLGFPPMPWTWNHPGPLSRKTASTTCRSNYIYMSLLLEYRHYPV